jgi:two-component system cell cycle sensor histidine kinase/response regulator CckA
MATPLRLLMLEDNPSDAELVLHELRRAGYEPTAQCVETEQDYLDHLQPVPEIILSDFTMPEMDALRALEIMQERQLDIPFIIVSGTIGEERAVQVMQRGATDYLIKDRLGRLGQSVAHALEKKRMRSGTRLAERRLAAQHAVTQTLAESLTLAAASSHILRTICQSLAWDFGALWQVEDGDNVLRCIDCWRDPAAAVVAFEVVTRESRFAPGASFPGRIWASRQPAWVADVAQESTSRRVPSAASVGLHGAFGFPIVLGTETLGVLEFFSREIKKPDEETLQMMLAIGRQLAQYIERKRGEASLRQSNQTLQALIQAAPLAIITLDQRSHVTMWNAAAEHIFGWQEAEILGRPLPLIPQDKRDVFENSIRNDVTAAREKGREMRLLHKNGSLLDVNLWTAPVTNAQGLLVGTMDLFLDVTGSKSLEAQLRQSQKMEAVGQLAAGVAHDFNNLLSIILGYSELLLAKLPGADPGREPLRQIRSAAERAAGLTRQLLAFGRKQILAPVVLDLNGLVAELDKMLRRLIGEDVELITVLHPALGQVKADPGQVEQIIMNLVVNARDAMPTGGRLTLQTDNTVLTVTQVRQNTELPPGPYTVLTVSDTGCGMDERTKARIFEPFFTTKEVGKGTGLGLATVFGIVKQSGGFIEVESALGTGSSLRVYLPQVRELTKLKRSAQGLVKMPKGDETILLVEDEDGLRELAQLVLEASGYKVLATRHGGEAVQVCHEYADVIHLLFTDVVMPKMSGRQLADLLTPSRPSMKVLYMSGYTDDTMVRHGIQNAGTNFLHKPFTPVALAQKVRAVLDGTNGHAVVASPLTTASVGVS